MTLPTDPIFYIGATLAIVLVGLAKGGFSGLGATTMPILALVMDPIKGAAMLLPILIVQDVVGVWAYRKTWDRHTVAIMIAGAVVGVLLGWWFAATVSVKFVQGMIGVIAIAFGTNRLLADFGIGITLRRALPEWVGSVWGMVSGFTSQVAHAGGPPFQVWAMTRNFERDVFVGTSCIFFAILNWIKVPAYFALGQFTTENMMLTMVFMPVAILSTLAGVWLVRRIDPARFFKIIYTVMVLIGIELLRVALT